MVAYIFQPRFELPIRQKVKLQTIRAEGNRVHARPGDVMQLYTGTRTRRCRLLATTVCARVRKIRFSFLDNFIEVGIPGEGLHETYSGSLDHFARLDGFADGDDMRGFWLRRHGVDDFTGLLIEWSAATLTVAA